MEKAVNSVLIFYVNGKKVIEEKPDPRATLLQYLRRKLCLTGTKEGCGQGGCGACTVMLSCYDSGNSKIKHFAVNACLYPLCAVHGLAVTTVEGVGSPSTGLHVVQQKLVETHGLQCGFCTPGFVMSAFALLRNNASPAQEQVEQAIQGNLCRCTGYRPILDALMTFSKDDCPMGDACCKNRPSKPESANQQEVRSGDDSQVPIFPPELQRSNVEFECGAVFGNDSYRWFRPTQLTELLDLKQKFPQAPVIMGNTTTARSITEGGFDSIKILIYGGSVQQLKYSRLLSDGLEVGGACTMTDLASCMENLAESLPAEKKRHMDTVEEMIKRYGSEQIRNVATVAGSLMSGRSNSDIKAVFKALNTKINIASAEETRHVMYGDIEDFQLASNEIITSVVIPFSSKDEHSTFFKMAERRTFSLAVVNAGMCLHMNQKNTVDTLRVCFGGIKKDVFSSIAVSRTAKNRAWDDQLLHDILSDIQKDLHVDQESRGDSYKVSVALSFWFKFFTQIQAELGQSEVDRSLTQPLSLPAYCGRQVFDPCTDEGQSENDALGRPLPSMHSEAAVSGEAIFVDDVPQQQGELFAALVISTKAHAKILSVDTAAAMALPGVLSYMDHNDIPGEKMWGAVIIDQEIFASEKVVSVGQPVGCVVANSREIALRGAALVKVTYEELTPILTIQEAIENNSFFDDPRVLVDGDIETGFAEADHVVEGEYSTGLQEHFYMETQSALAIPGENQEIQIYCATQNLPGIQGSVSRMLNIPLNKVTCKVKRVGGAFGGKELSPFFAAAPAALAAFKTKLAVRCVLPRSTDMVVTGKRHPFQAKYKVGCDSRGKITTMDVKLYGNGGYSLDVSEFVRHVVVQSLDSGYKIENVRIEAVICKTNTPSNTAFRAFGNPQAAVIMEDIIFKVATAMNLSSEEVREINLYKDGDITPFGTEVKNCTLPEIWKNCRSEAQYEERLKQVQQFNRENKWKKRGLSMTATKMGIGFGPIFFNQGAALVNIYIDGTVLVSHGGIEMGQGINTKMIQVASHELGVPREKIHTIETNTMVIPNTMTTAGSMGTDIYAPAVKDACETLNKRLQPLREKMVGCPWENLIQAAYFNRVQLSATGFSCIEKKEDFDLFNKKGSVYNYYTFGVACSEVEMDVLTGETQVLQSDLYMDIGKSLNPALDIGQIEGAFVQGLGMLTSEDMEIDARGQVTHCNALSYKIPNVTTIPRKLTVTLVKNHNIRTVAYSSKGTGEPPYILSMSVIAAIKEAVLEARKQAGISGYFRLDSPATVQRIQEACGQQLKHFNH